MNKEKSVDSDNTIYMNLLRNNISPIDLFILSRFNAGDKLETLSKMVGKEFNIPDPEKVVDERIKKMQSEDNLDKKIILDNNPQYIVNPAKLFDKILIVPIKANLPSFEGRLADINLRDVFEMIIELNNNPTYGKPIKQLFTLYGWEYDFLAIVFENDLERFISFKDHLIRNGIVKDIKPISVDPNEGFYFNPVALPDFNQFRRFLVNYRDRIDAMISELKKQDIVGVKTETYFGIAEYGIEVISGTNKGNIYPLEKNELKIGRYPDNDIVLSKNDMAVSRRHAKITIENNSYVIEDFSLNGISINNDKINHDKKELHDGDKIRIGETTFKFKKLKK